MQNPMDEGASMETPTHLSFKLSCLSDWKMSWGIFHWLSKFHFWYSGKLKIFKKESLLDEKKRDSKFVFKFISKTERKMGKNCFRILFSFHMVGHSLQIWCEQPILWEQTTRRKLFITDSILHMLREEKVYQYKHIKIFDGKLLF